jgi:uncharacterized protein (TIGR01777 family)
VQSLSEISPHESIDVIINLAGATISKRWTESYKRELIASRVDTTKAIISLVSALEKKPDLLISASAIGYYGTQDSTALDETSQPTDDFTHRLCSAWEKEAMHAEQYGVRTCIARLGVVLGKRGGALQKMLPAFTLGLGGKIGTGMQYFSWVHIDDVLSAFDFLVKTKSCRGVYNVTAPTPVSNAAFTAALGKALGCPTLIPAPASLIKLIFGEMGECLLLKGQNVIPKKLTEAGFTFTYPTVDSALTHIMR